MNIFKLLGKNDKKCLRRIIYNYKPQVIINKSYYNMSINKNVYNFSEVVGIF